MRLLLFISLILANVAGYSQKLNKDVLYIQISCGYAAMDSKEIRNMNKLIKSKDYVTIRSNLVNGSEMEKLLSCIALKEIMKWEKITLTAEEEEQIQSVKQSRQKFKFCHTCTYQSEGMVKNIFSTLGDNEYIYRLIRDGMFR